MGLCRTSAASLYRPNLPFDPNLPPSRLHTLFREHQKPHSAPPDVTIWAYSRPLHGRHTNPNFSLGLDEHRTEIPGNEGGLATVLRILSPNSEPGSASDTPADCAPATSTRHRRRQRNAHSARRTPTGPSGAGASSHRRDGRHDPPYPQDTARLGAHRDAYRERRGPDMDMRATPTLLRPT